MLLLLNANAYVQHVLTFDPRDAFEMTTDGVATNRLTGIPPDNDWSGRPLDDDWTANTYKVQPQSAMPNAFRACLSAGSALIFDSS